MKPIHVLYMIVNRTWISFIHVQCAVFHHTLQSMSAPNTIINSNHQPPAVLPGSNQFIRHHRGWHSTPPSTVHRMIWHSNLATHPKQNNNTEVSIHKGSLPSTSLMQMANGKLSLDPDA
jgi:hypothetical protein